jgi:hypothetical protein
MNEGLDARIARTPEGRKKIADAVRNSYDYISKMTPSSSFRSRMHYVCYELNMDILTVEQYLPEESKVYHEMREEEAAQRKKLKSKHKKHIKK